MAKFNLGNQNDRFTGTSGDDEIYGNGGADYITAGAGNDFVNGGIGDDAIAGGSGNDWLLGGEGDDTINGESGNDVIKDQAGDDTYFGGEGDDYLEAGYGNDTVYGEAGNDTLKLLYGNWGADHARLYGGPGNDTYTLQTAELDPADLPTIGENPGEGTDTIELFSNWFYLIDSYKIPANVENLTLSVIRGVNLYYPDIKVIGNELDNEIVGDWDDNTLQGGAGNDKLYAGGGWDNLYGEDGDDFLSFLTERGREPSQQSGGNAFGGAGNDVYQIGADNLVYIHEQPGGGYDIVRTQQTWVFTFDNVEEVRHVGPTSAYLYGNEQDNIMGSADGDDTFDMKGGNDKVYAGAGKDVIFGGAGNDLLYGDSGADIIYGGNDNDTLMGGIGDDQLFGDAGADRLEGGEGDDLLFGGAGADVLFGGDGNDRFVLQQADDSALFKGVDKIMDFRTGQDRIAFNFDARPDTAAMDKFKLVADFSGQAGELRVLTNGLNAMVQADINGDGLPDLVVQVMGVQTLGLGDFLGVMA